GGIVAICGAWDMRPEPMLRQRVAERLSVALVEGSADWALWETREEYLPVLTRHGVRTNLWVIQGMGHAYPSTPQLFQVYQWVEAGLPIRRLGAALFPASRLVGPVSPQDWSTALIYEADERLQMPGGLASALYCLQAVVDRWPGLPAAKLAGDLL